MDIDSKMTTNLKKKKKSIVESIISLKVKEMYSHIAQGQENVTFLGYCLLTYFKKQYSMKNVNLSWGAGSADQEAVEEFFKCLLSVM